MKDYDKNNESSYFKYWNPKNLYGWTMSQKLPVIILRALKMLSHLIKIS